MGLPPRLPLAAVAVGFAACGFPEYAVEEDPLAVLARICSDGAVSGAETGVDCGGSCPPCAENEPCLAARDCLTLRCEAGVCQAPGCEDGIKNGAESDRDCGGQCQARCETDATCGVAADCASGVCKGAVCVAPTCGDQTRNGDETGVDCGGSCAGCGSGMTCATDRDCASGKCVQLVCVAQPCTDGVRDGDESDVDCGGKDCAPCPSTASCNEDADCASASCGKTLHCADSQCDDGIFNGDETDVDCGGAECRGCAELGRCQSGSDCQTDVCQSGRCVPAAATGQPISQAGWSGKASQSFAGDKPSDVFDGDSTSIWSTGAVQQPGMSFELDFGELRAFYSIEVECSVQSDAAASMDVYLWQSGEPGAPVRTHVVGFPETSIQFATPQVARYLRLVLTESKSAWWCIGELNLYR
ncbi:MAG TPA: discoidin domain-containing protein [Polyangiaceae bacterium]|nr:discoidin domain-containing protein [Polyangiaceae bacterium]